MIDYWMKINHFELGVLMGSIPEDKMAEMEKEVPKLWLQMQIIATDAYAYGDHPMKRQAWKDLRNLKGRLHRLLLKEEKYNKEHGIK